MKSTEITCPKHLNDEAKKEWRRITKSKEILGLLPNLDRATLAAYCQAWGRWVEAELKLSDSPTILKTKGGKVIQNPYYAISNRAMEQLTKIAAELGMTPASRKQVKEKTEKEKENKFTQTMW